MLQDHRESGCGVSLDLFYFSEMTESLPKQTMYDQFFRSDPIEQLRLAWPSHVEVSVHDST